MSTYNEDISEYWHERMPAEIKELSRKANHDLYFGPSYYDADDIEVSCFDEGAIQLDFKAACKAITEWCDENMYPLYLEDGCGILEEFPPEFFEEVENDDGEVVLVEVERPYYEWDIRDQMRIVFGKELAHYL